MSGRHGPRTHLPEEPRSREPREPREPREQPRSQGRQNEYFIPAEGIAREVIQSDICRYLGRDALVRPCEYQNRSGYLITAYRNLTSKMIEDLKTDSARWAEENRENREAGYRPVSYHQSATFAGTYEQPQTTQPPQSSVYSDYPNRQYDEPGRNQPSSYGQPPFQPPAGYQHPQGYVLPGQEGFAAQPQRGYPQGAPGMQYEYEPRQQGYQPRTPQSQEDIPSSRGPGGYIYGGTPHMGSQPPQQSGQTAYIDPTTGRAVYVDPYDTPAVVRRPGQNQGPAPGPQRESTRGEQPRRMR